VVGPESKELNASAVQLGISAARHEEGDRQQQQHQRLERDDQEHRRHALDSMIDILKTGVKNPKLINARAMQWGASLPPHRIKGLSLPRGRRCRGDRLHGSAPEIES
jgi:hypothetical protein